MMPRYITEINRNKKEAQRIAELEAENERLRKDAERYEKWKREGMSYSNGFYHLDLYGGTDDMEWTNPDAVADHAAREGK